MKVKFIWQAGIILCLIFLIFLLVNVKNCPFCQKFTLIQNTRIIEEDQSDYAENSIDEAELINKTTTGQDQIVEVKTKASSSQKISETTTPSQKNNIEKTLTEPIQKDKDKEQVNQISNNNKIIDFEFIRSVRIDLSSQSPEIDMEKQINDIINRLKQAGVNTVYLSPWSDGFANYHSELAPLNSYGQFDFVKKFIQEAHQNNIWVFAWFVVGKDNFPSQIHPDWFAITKTGEKYYQNEEPEVNLPFASLANSNYINYHLSLLREINYLAWDGWVISEPLIGWGDRYDDTYTDFSSAMIELFKKKSTTDPNELFNSESNFYYEDDPGLYTQWIDLRAQVVSDFVAKTMAAIRNKSNKPIVITLFTEPGPEGNLISLESLREWLGEDIIKLTELRPDYFEIQCLWADFEYPQTPNWTQQMINEFSKQINYSIPLLVSVQGWDVSANEFYTAIQTAQNNNIHGISTYAYHTLNENHWKKLQELWNN